MKKKSFSFGLMEIAKWISFLLIILLVIQLAKRGKVSSADFNSASNDVTAAVDTSVMTKGNSGTLKQLYDLDSGDFQGFLLYISSANADKVGLASDQETAPISVDENGLAEQSSMWAKQPVGTEEFLMIKLDSTSQAGDVRKAIEKRVDNMKEELKKSSKTASSESTSTSGTEEGETEAVTSASGTEEGETETVTSTSGTEEGETEAVTSASEAESGGVEAASSSFAGTETAASSSAAAGTEAASSSAAAGTEAASSSAAAGAAPTESVVSSSEETPADAESLLDQCIIDVVGNYVLFISAPNATEVDQLFRKSI